MKKSLILIFMSLLLTACVTRVLFEEGGEEEKCQATGGNSYVVTILCGESSISINSEYSYVSREQSCIPFIPKKKQNWIVGLAISMSTTDSASLIMNSQAMTIDQPSRLKTPIFLKSESFTKTTSSKETVEQEMKKIFEIEVDSVTPFVLSGLEMRIGNQEYNFNGIRVLSEECVFWDF